MSEENENVTAEDVKAMKKDELVALIEENNLEIEGYADMKVPALKAAVLKVLELEDGDAAEDGDVYTYVGAGADSPRVINLMGRQKFVRGQAVKVTDPVLLAKLPGIGTFVKGKADEETLHRIDEEGKAGEEDQKAKDKETNAAYHKKFKGEK